MNRSANYLLSVVIYVSNSYNHYPHIFGTTLFSSEDQSCVRFDLSFFLFIYFLCTY